MGDMKLEDIKRAISDISDSFSREQDRENVLVFGNWIEKAVDKYPHLLAEKPETMNLMLQLTVEHEKSRFANMMVSTYYPNQERKISYLLSDLIENYDFYNEMIKSVYVPVTGSTCSTDVSRWLLKQYKTYLLTGEIFETPEENYWTPKAGKPSDWIAFIETLPWVRRGKKVDEFTALRTELINQFKK